MKNSNMAMPITWFVVIIMGILIELMLLVQVNSNDSPTILKYSVYIFVAMSPFFLLAYHLLRSSKYMIIRIWLSGAIISIMSVLLWLVKVQNTPTIMQICFCVFVTLAYTSLFVYVYENRKELE